MTVDAIPNLCRLKSLSIKSLISTSEIIDPNDPLLSLGARRKGVPVALALALRLALGLGVGTALLLVLEFGVGAEVLVDLARWNELMDDDRRRSPGHMLSKESAESAR